MLRFLLLLALSIAPLPMIDVCLSVTNYYPYNEYGQLEANNGQADEDPYHTALMYTVTPEWNGLAAAVPIPLLNRLVVLSDGTELLGWDTFGQLEYQQGVFWHYTYETWV
jgi:hypothetical protein